MHKGFKFIIFLLCCSINNSLYSAAVSHSRSLNKMSCCQLMHALIEESSFGETFKKLNLALAFERDNEQHVGIKIAEKMENDRYGVYGNYELDLVNATLKHIDRDPPIPIKINKKYIPFVAAKCTREENEYINTGRLPDENGD